MSAVQSSRSANGSGPALPAVLQYVWRVIPIHSIAWSACGSALRILDQTRLPQEEIFCDLRQIDEIVEAIRTLRIRGAPAIGVAAAMGLVIALDHASEGNGTAARGLLPAFADRLIDARPTAVNLEWAVNRLRVFATSVADEQLIDSLRSEANRILDEDALMCDRIGWAGLSLVSHGTRVMTHCNAGALATAGIGTALAPIYMAHEHGRDVQVFANETRPLRQGARLTAWELQRAGIRVTVLPDSAAASLLRQGTIDLVIVGADRVARNGDVANKIGTYPLALAAREHHVPFYVAFPWSTVDQHAQSGNSIPIEKRSASELQPLPPNVEVYNPSFDVTPAALITGYITDRGLVHPPFHAAFAELSNTANISAASYEMNA